MCIEDIPRQERAADHYTKQSAYLDSKILTAWNNWDESKKLLQMTCNQAVSECPDLSDFIDKIKLQSELRQVTASNNLRYKLLAIENGEINVYSEYMTEMPTMLKKLYMTLKGYDKVPPTLTDEYLELMKKAKSAKSITWSDSSDSHFEFISNLKLEKPSSSIEFIDKVNDTIDILTDSEDLTDVENQEPLKLCTKKRKGTPVKLMNNETILINDSFESLDVTRNLNSAKKVKLENNVVPQVENFTVIDPKDLNSTFVLAEKLEAFKKPVKVEPKVEQPKKGLIDRTNVIPRTIAFNGPGVYFILTTLIYYYIFLVTFESFTGTKCFLFLTLP